MHNPIRLSLCIATFGRADFIGETLQSVMPQVGPEVEVIVVDGASPDHTPEVLQEWVKRYPRLIYRRETANEGVDRDFDRAVRYARGEYCWLLSDDDLLVPDALATVLRRLAADPELLVVNAEVRDKELQQILKPRQLALMDDARFDESGLQNFFVTAASFLSFIGAVVIRRDVWLSRRREPYFGSLFVHVGVIFQHPALRHVEIVARPLIRIRYGNAMWSARGFEIWTRLWPDLIWSFDHFTSAARAQVVARQPETQLRTLVWYRAIGAMQPDRLRNPRALARWIAMVPESWMNMIGTIYCVFAGGPDRAMKLYDLERAACSTAVARWLAKRFLSRETGR